jgi:hypothetical protein
LAIVEGAWKAVRAVKNFDGGKTAEDVKQRENGRNAQREWLKSRNLSL